jgi:hypothetical protein
LAVNKQAAQQFDVERFDLMKLSELEFRKQSQIKISNKFTALESMNDSEDKIRLGRTSKSISKSQVKRV